MGKKKGKTNQENNINLTSVSISSATSATMIGFSSAIIILLLTLTEKIENSFDFQIVMFFYIFCIIINFLAIEFFILTSYDFKNIDLWSVLGSVCYGIAKGSMIIGISLTFVVIINFISLAYITLIIVTISYVFYYIVRCIYIKEEPLSSIRWIARGLFFIEIGIGFILIYWIN